MAVTDKLNKPDANAHQMGRFTLNRIFLVDGAAAAPVVPTNLENIVQIDYGAPSWDFEADVLHQGSAEKTHKQYGPRWDGTITVLSGKVVDVLATLQNLTMGAGGHVAISTRMDNDLPVVIWEAICRDDDNSTHLFSLIIQDMILDNIALENPIDYADKTIPFHTYHEPFLLYAGYHMVYELFASAATPGSLHLSATPATLVSHSNHDDWDFDKLVYIKHKDNSEGDEGMTRRITGATLTGSKLDFTSGTPGATPDRVGILYATKT